MTARQCLQIAFTAMIFVGTMSYAFADPKLPSIFGDHMVLQQAAKLPIWGTADAGEKISVTVGDKTGTATADVDGRWRVDLPPIPNGTPPLTLTITGKNKLVFTDVLIGDVWICSGQSNMEVPLAYAYNSKEAIANANDPKLRLFIVARKSSLHPLTDVTSPGTWRKWTASETHQVQTEHAGEWIACEPHTVGQFSGVGYFFGQALRSHLNHPIGLIEDAWGGTCAEAWMSLASLQDPPAFTTYVGAYEQNLADFPKLETPYKDAMATYQSEMNAYQLKIKHMTTDWLTATKTWKATTMQTETSAPQPKRPQYPARPKSPTPPDGGSFGPTNLFNGMVAPIIPFAIKGVVWYQGESNTRTKAIEYRQLFPRLITDWRQHWGQGDFPFLYVQISHFLYAGDGSSSLIREAQLQTLSVPNTAMVVTVDIPCDDAGHPRDKLDPGKRLCLAARHVAYHEDLVYSGPLYQSMKIDGPVIRISFTQTGSGLMIGTTPYQPPTSPQFPVPVLPNDKLVGFTIAGADKNFVAADAVISGNTVLVSSSAVSNPIAVRFAWGDRVQCNLYNREGLPASPFRTDQWNDFKFRTLAPGMIPPTITARSSQ